MATSRPRAGLRPWAQVTRMFNRKHRANLNQKTLQIDHTRALRKLRAIGVEPAVLVLALELRPPRRR